LFRTRLESVLNPLLDVIRKKIPNCQMFAVKHRVCCLVTRLGYKNLLVLRYD